MKKTDTALTLRIAKENHEQLSDSDIDHLLEQSNLIQRLTDGFTEHPLSAVFRIVCLSEIPYAERLPYTQKLTDYINQHVATLEGFSCLGGLDELVPCYNAMLLEAYTRLGFAESKEVQAALQWVKRYQLFDRNQTTAWPYNGVCKHGGCLGATPCYIGIGKTVRALITYSEFTGQKDHNVEILINQGIEYMLRHRLYQRLSNGKPICQHINDIMMPQSYALSLTDLVYIVGKRKLKHNKNSIDLMQLLKKKEVAENRWKIDYLYTYKGYVGFENRRKASEWISFLFPLWLSDD